MRNADDVVGTIMTVVVIGVFGLPVVLILWALAWEVIRTTFLH